MAPHPRDIGMPENAGIARRRGISRILNAAGVPASIG
jgi:hypothetical protein